MWATRCLHEASLYKENCFLTLTYDEENLPWDQSVNKKHFQDFMKRLRSANNDKRIRYFHCGEYGEELRRPHYHALIFNHDFQDRTLWKKNPNGDLYTSETLSKLWPMGFSTVGAITWGSAAYCARYTQKKITGQKADDHYWGITDTGIEIQLEPEYATMSLKPGIGKDWFDRFKDDCFPSDFITVAGKKKRIPKYYDKLLAEHHELDLIHVKENRKRRAYNRNSTPGPKLAAQEQCAKARLNLRSLEL